MVAFVTLLENLYLKKTRLEQPWNCENPKMTRSECSVGGEEMVATTGRPEMVTHVIAV